MTTKPVDYPCKICGAQDWLPHYKGFIRDGSFGCLSQNECTIVECAKCGVQRLEESACKNEDFYEGSNYRKKLNEPTSAEGFFEQKDALQFNNLKMLWPYSLRGKTVADIGCGGGSFLDHVKGLAQTGIAIEPCENYHQSLRKRGYHIYPNLESVAKEIPGKVDFGFCFSVIEHVENPRHFLTQAYEMLSRDGFLLVSTPNRADFLMETLGDEYKQFYYRTVHRWYFNIDSFTYLAITAGFKVVKSKCLHRFGLSNALTWLKDKKPNGDSQIEGFNDPLIDEFWKKYLESKNIGDYLYFLLAPQA